MGTRAVTASDPLALLITERNPLALTISARDPLALAVRLNLIPSALDFSAVYDMTSGGLLYDEPSEADITWRAAS